MTMQRNGRQLRHDDNNRNQRCDKRMTRLPRDNDNDLNHNIMLRLGDDDSDNDNINDDIDEDVEDDSNEGGDYGDDHYHHDESHKEDDTDNTDVRDDTKSSGRNDVFVRATDIRRRLT